jgi:hypothetical protein
VQVSLCPTRNLVMRVGNIQCSAPGTHIRSSQAEVVTECGASIVRAIQTAPLHLGHHVRDEVLKTPRLMRRCHYETVARRGGTPLFDPIRDLGGTANPGMGQQAASGNAHKVAYSRMRHPGLHHAVAHGLHPDNPGEFLVRKWFIHALGAKS